MKPCINCAELKVDPEEPPRYDVDNPEPANPAGPYCTDCWPSTYTAQEGAA